MSLGKLLRSRIHWGTSKSPRLTCRLKDDVAQKAVDFMNSVLDGAKIKFNLGNVSRIDNVRCNAGLTDNQAMDSLKAEVHQGNTSTLNLVYVPTNQGPGVKGVCVLPQPGDDIASNIGSKDGCVVAADTLTDNSGASITTTHEMGHWLSLPHVNGGGQSRGGGPFNRVSSGHLRRQSGGGEGNVMEPVSSYVSLP